MVSANHASSNSAQSDKDLACNRLSNDIDKQTVYFIKQFVSEVLFIWSKKIDQKTNRDGRLLQNLYIQNHTSNAPVLLSNPELL